MTTPVTPQPEAPKPESARDFFNQDDSVLIKEWGVQTPQEGAPEAPAIEEPIKLTPVETVPTDSEGSEAAPADKAEVAVPKVERKLMTEFRVLDDEGELEIPEIQVEFKAKGEVRKLPLDHVVRLAQFGYANEEREQQVLAAKRFVGEAQQKEAEYQNAINQYEGYYEKIFNDPAFYEEARLVYQQQNSPESRALRAEKALAAERQQKVYAREEETIAGFVQQTVMPNMTRLLEENPMVNQTELVGRYTMLTAPLLVNGRVPLARLREVEHLVTSDLTTWAQQTQYERVTAKQASEREAAKATQQIAATKRQAARVFSQPGRVAEPQTKPTKFESARDWLNATLPTNSE